MIQLIACRSGWLGPTKLMDDSIANLPTRGDPQAGYSIGSTLHLLNLCKGSVCQWQICPISCCLPVDVCQHSWIHVYTVTHTSCMCADLHPSRFMQHCCEHKRDSHQPVTHSDFTWVDIQKNTGSQGTIRNEMYYAVWLSWHVSLCLCQQRN